MEGRSYRVRLAQVAQHILAHQFLAPITVVFIRSYRRKFGAVENWRIKKSVTSGT
jgi:hypothetical protein